MSGTEQAEVTDFDEPVGKDMLEEATDELLGGEGAVLELVSGGVFVGESDLAMMQAAEAVVGDSDAKDVRSEILEGLLAGADGFGVNHPFLFPS